MTTVSQWKPVEGFDFLILERFDWGIICIGYTPEQEMMSLIFLVHFPGRE